MIEPSHAGLAGAWFNFDEHEPPTHEFVLEDGAAKTVNPRRSA